MTTVLVAGAAGQLGRDVVARLVAAGHAVAGRTREQLDTLDSERCVRATRAILPRVVVDCADVTPEGAAPSDVAVASRNLAAAAAMVDAFTIYISCAEVFDGRGPEPYSEADEPRPADAFGAAKLEAERAVAAANERHAVVRTSWLFGLGAYNLVEAVLDAAADSDVVPVAADAKSCPTYTYHFSDALVRLVENPAYGILHVTGHGSCTKLQFARNVLRMAGLRARVVPLLDRGVGAPPRNLVLASRRTEIPPLPRWQTGVRSYLNARESAFAS